jgi:hypothetical protein
MIRKGNEKWFVRSRLLLEFAGVDGFMLFHRGKGRCPYGGLGETNEVVISILNNQNV